MRAIGTRFLHKFSHAWSGPCAACGHAKPTHFEVINGKRKKVACPGPHGRVRGMEVTMTLCEITGHKFDGTHYDYAVLEILSVENPLPGTQGCMRTGTGGGMTADAFERYLGGDPEDFRITLVSE